MHYQSSTQKLAWGDLHATLGRAPSKRSYAERKKLVVDAAYYLLDMEVPVPRSCKLPCHAVQSLGQYQQVYLKERKKDDLADALLHALAFLHSCQKTSGAARAKKRARGDSHSTRRQMLADTGETTM